MLLTVFYPTSLCPSACLYPNDFPVKEEEEKDEGEAKDVCIPTHWTKLDPKSMKVRFKENISTLIV